MKPKSPNDCPIEATTIKEKVEIGPMGHAAVDYINQLT